MDKNKLRILWENNPDTPITSSVLSNVADIHANYGGLLYKSNLKNLESGNYSDEKLKIRANSRIKFEQYFTRVGLFTNGSFVSHDSKFSPIEMDNLIIGDDFNGEKMIYISEGSQNLITNPSFEEGLSDGWASKCSSNVLGHQIDDVPETFDPIWGEEFSAITEVVEIENNLHAFRMFTGAFGRTQLERSFDLYGFDKVSLSFNYKNNKDFKYYLVCKKDGMNVYWNGNIWSNTVYYFSVPIPSPDKAGQWQKTENTAIDIAYLEEFANNIQLFIYAEKAYTEVLLDNFQIEAHTYVSSFSEETIEPSILKYSRQLIDLEKGLLDFSFYPRTRQDFIIISSNTLPQIDKPAFEIKYRAVEDVVTFKIFNTDANQYNEVTCYAALTQVIQQNRYLRVICNWDKDVGISCILNTNKLFSKGNDPFIPFEPDKISDVSIGYQKDSLYSNCYLKQLKINTLPKKNEEILIDLNNEPKIDEVIYKIGIVPEQDIIIEYTYNPDSRYYLYGFDEGNEQTIAIILSQEKIIGKKEYALIGGFFTDSNAQVIESSIWDVVSRKYQSLHIDRMEIRGHDSPTYAVSVRTTPITEKDDIRSTIPFHTTHNFYGRHWLDELNSGVQYFEMNNEGWFAIDNIKFDANKITTRNYADAKGAKNNDLEITVSDQGGEANPPKIWVHAHEIVVQSGNKDIKIDDIRINDNYIYTMPGRSLHIDVSQTDAVSGTPTNNGIFYKGYDLDFNATHDLTGLVSRDFYWDINRDAIFDVYRDVKIDTSAAGDIYLNGMKFTHSGLENISYIKNAGDLSIYSDTGSINIRSGTSGIINLDDLKVKNNRLYREVGDIEINSPGTIFLGLKSTAALPFDISKAYSIGQYVIYDGELYKCKVAKAANEAWNATKWNNQIFTTSAAYAAGEIVKYNSLLYKANVSKAAGTVWTPTNWTVFDNDPTQTKVCIRADDFVIDSKSIEFNNVDAGTFIRFDDIKLKQSDLYTEGLKPINITASSYLNATASAGDITVTTNSNIIFAQTGGNLWSRVRSKFTKDVLVPNIIFNRNDTLGDVVHDLKMAQVGNDFKIDVRSGKRLVIENGTFNASSGLVDSGDLMFIMDTAGVNIAKNTTIGGNLTVQGNLTIQGDTTTFNVGTMVVEDAIITLSSGVTTGAPMAWSGVEVNRGTGKNKAVFYWHEGRQKWCVDNAENIQTNTTAYQQGSVATNRSGMHPILYDGYSNDFVNVNIVSTSMTGFKMENNYAVAGFELMTQGDGGNNLPGKGKVRFGFHMNKADGYIRNKTGYESQSIGMWDQMDSTNGKWSWIYEAAGNESAAAIMTLDSVGTLWINKDFRAAGNITVDGGNITTAAAMTLTTAGKFAINHGSVTTQVIDTSNNVSFAGNLKAKDLLNIRTGTSTFKGNNASQKIAHGLTDINGISMKPRFVGITPSVDPSGYLGEIWYTADSTYIEVRNSGTATTQFTWMAL